MFLCLILFYFSKTDFVSFPSTLFFCAKRLKHPLTVGCTAEDLSEQLKHHLAVFSKNSSTQVKCSAKNIDCLTNIALSCNSVAVHVDLLSAHVIHIPCKPFHRGNKKELQINQSSTQTNAGRTIKLFTKLGDSQLVT